MAASRGGSSPSARTQKVFKKFSKKSDTHAADVGSATTGSVGLTGHRLNGDLPATFHGGHALPTQATADGAWRRMRGGSVWTNV